MGSMCFTRGCSSSCGALRVSPGCGGTNAAEDVGASRHPRCAASRAASRARRYGSSQGPFPTMVEEGSPGGCPRNRVFPFSSSPFPYQPGTLYAMSSPLLPTPPPPTTFPVATFPAEESAIPQPHETGKGATPVGDHPASTGVVRVPI